MTNIIEEFDEIENIINDNSLADAFIKEYCNDHGKLRWLRGVFFDEDDKMNTIIKWLEFADKKLQQALSQRDKEWEEKIKEERKRLTSRIKCANCNNLTNFTPLDFDENKDLDDIFCSEECRYNFETGNPGEEY